MDLLKDYKDSIGDKKLSQVSGGKLNKTNFSNIVKSLAITGALCMPVQGGNASVTQSAKKENKKSSYSVGLPTKAKVGIGVTGVVGPIGLGTLLFRALANKSEKTSKKLENASGPENENDKTLLYTDITEAMYIKMHGDFMQIAAKPQNCKPVDLKKYTVEELKNYILAELLKWYEAMDRYYIIRTTKCGKKVYVVNPSAGATFAAEWNANLEHLVCACLAVLSIWAKSGLANEDDIKDELTELSRNPFKPSDGNQMVTICNTWYPGIPPAKTAPVQTSNSQSPDLYICPETTEKILLTLGGVLTVNPDKMGQDGSIAKRDKRWLDRVDDLSSDLVRIKCTTAYHKMLQQAKTMDHSEKQI